MTPISEPAPRYRSVWLTLAWLLLACVCAGSLAPSPAGPPGVSDKLVHFVAYAALGFAFAGALGRARYAAIALGLLAVGAGLEAAQALLTSSRRAEWWDLVADAGGIGAGLVLAAAVPGGWCRRVEDALGFARGRA